jgi:GTP-binding protein
MFRAVKGGQGSGQTSTGKDGKDLTIKVPPGTAVRDAESGELLADLVEPGLRWVAAAGGKGGRGNERFKTATNQAPRRADPGIPGESKTLALELKLVADAGLVGFPNAGQVDTALRGVERPPEDRRLPVHHAAPGARGGHARRGADVRARGHPRADRGRLAGQGPGPRVPAPRRAHADARLS